MSRIIVKWQSGQVERTVVNGSSGRVQSAGWIEKVVAKLLHGCAVYCRLFIPFIFLEQVFFENLRTKKMCSPVLLRIFANYFDWVFH